MMTQTLLMTMILQFRTIQSSMDSISTFLLLHRRLLLFWPLHLHWTFLIFFTEIGNRWWYVNTFALKWATSQ
jgi:hypothetical protein